LELRKGQRLDGLLAGHHPVDELLLGLDPPVGMAVADLSGCDLVQLDLVGFEQGLSQDLDTLFDRRLVVGLSAGEAAKQKAGSAESKRACNHQVTTRYVHGSLLGRLDQGPVSPKRTPVRPSCRSNCAALQLADTGAAVMTIGVLVLYAGGHLEVWHLYVAEAISGICWAFQGPAYTAATTMLLPSRHYARAAGLRSVATFGADAVAPFLAGV